MGIIQRKQIQIRGAGVKIQSLRGMPQKVLFYAKRTQCYFVTLTLSFVVCCVQIPLILCKTEIVLIWVIKKQTGFDLVILIVRMISERLYKLTKDLPRAIEVLNWCLKRKKLCLWGLKLFFLFLFLWSSSFPWQIWNSRLAQQYSKQTTKTWFAHNKTADWETF